MLKQISKLVLTSLAVALVCNGLSSVAFAQLPPARSPWLDMFNNPGASSMTDGYLRIVKPQQDMMKASAAQARQIQLLQAQQNALQAPGGGGASGSSMAMGAGALGLTGSPGSASSARNVLAPPQELPSTQRNPAGFQQYLHYYPAYSMPRKPVPNFSATGQRR